MCRLRWQKSARISVSQNQDSSPTKTKKQWVYPLVTHHRVELAMEAPGAFLGGFLQEGAVWPSYFVNCNALEGDVHRRNRFNTFYVAPTSNARPGCRAQVRPPHNHRPDRQVIRISTPTVPDDWHAKMDRVQGQPGKIRSRRVRCPDPFECRAVQARDRTGCHGARKSMMSARSRRRIFPRLSRNSPSLQLATSSVTRITSKRSSTARSAKKCSSQSSRNWKSPAGDGFLGTRQVMLREDKDVKTPAT